MKQTIILLLFLFCSQALAGGWGIAGGMNVNFAENENPPPYDLNLNPAVGFQFGTFYSHRFEKFRLRSHLLFRTLRVKHKEPARNLQLYSFQLALPVLFQQMLSESVGYFIGPDFAYNLSPSAKLNLDKIDLGFQQITTSAMAGLTFRITKRLYVDLYYNHGITELAENVHNQSIGVQFVTYFERQKKIR